VTGIGYGHSAKIQTFSANHVLIKDW
jgi:hypothetical protein